MAFNVDTVLDELNKLPLPDSVKKYLAEKAHDFFAELEAVPQDIEDTVVETVAPDAAGDDAPAETATDSGEQTP